MDTTKAMPHVVSRVWWWLKCPQHGTYCGELDFVSRGRAVCCCADLHWKWWRR